LDCAASLEVYNNNNEVQKRESFKKVMISLNRNEFSEIILNISVSEKNVNKSRNIVLAPDDLIIHRKFIKEGKASITFKESRTKLLISNAPRNELVIFIKTLAAKVAGLKEKPKMSIRAKLMSDKGNSIEGISPVTSKDIQKLQQAEAGGHGVLKARGYTPKNASPLAGQSPLTSGKMMKRKRLDDKENGASPLAKRRVGEGSSNGPTPKRQMTCARRKLREDRARVMTTEQKYVVEMVKAGKNIFFTGGAGTGKSFLINKIIGVLPPEHTFITASTGVAAFQIGGTTLHSFAGIGSGANTIQKCIELAQRKTVSVQWKRAKHLIIDEVSMVDGNYFKKLEGVARVIRGNDKPFGGIQLILTGDFLQLPPVVKGDEERRFAFETSAWSRCIQVNVELTQVKRQSDQNLVSILNKLRLGQCGEKEAEILMGTKKHKLGDDGIVPTKLCTHTDDVNLINNKELNKCAGEEKIYRARDSDSGALSFINSHTPVDQILRLRVGAQVMLLKNLNVVQGLVNGARGAVQSFDSEGFPVVRFIGGKKESVKTEKWQIKGGSGSVLSRTQLPLRLAWAFSIHKSQGMTLDCVEVSLSRVFECGQAYVALSRAKSLETLRILDFRPGCVRADAKVLKFYSNLKCSKPMLQQRIGAYIQEEEDR